MTIKKKSKPSALAVICKKESNGKLTTTQLIEISSAPRATIYDWSNSKNPFKRHLLVTAIHAAVTHREAPEAQVFFADIEGWVKPKLPIIVTDVNAMEIKS